MLKKLKSFFNPLNYVAYISLILIFIYIFYTFNYLPRLKLDFIVLLRNFKFYITSLLNPKVKAPTQIYEELTSSSDLISYLPDDMKEFISLIGLSIEITFSRGYLKEIMRIISSFLSNISLFSLPFITIIPFLPSLFDSIFFKHLDYKENNVTSRVFKVEWLYDHSILIIKNYLTELKDYFVSKKYFCILYILMLIYSVNGFSVLFDLINYYIYFFLTFNFAAIWKFFLVVMIDLSHTLLSFHKMVYIIFGIIIFFCICSSRAKRKILWMMEHDKTVCVHKLGVLNIVNGPMESGKTRLLVDMALTTEEVHRNNVNELLETIKCEFPYFHFDEFEKFLDEKISSRLILNFSDIESIIDDLKEDFLNNYENDDYNLFHYDYKRFGLEYDDNLVNRFLFDSLTDYAKAYFIYTTSGCGKLAANLGIRGEALLYTEGHSKKYLYDYLNSPSFDKYEENQYCKIVDFDLFRVSKKMDKENELGFIPIGGVYCFTEFDKERGNALDNLEIRMKDENANVKNDGLLKSFKTARHPEQIRGKSFCCILTDGQRASSFGVALTGIAESVMIIDKSKEEKGNTYPFLDLRTLGLNLLESFARFYLNNHFFHRNDRTLMSQLCMYIIDHTHKKLDFFKNNYGYIKMNIICNNGYMAENNMQSNDEFKYFICYKKTYSGRYATDNLKNFSYEKSKHHNVGFADLTNFESLYSTIDEYKRMHSYFFNDQIEEVNAAIKNSASSTIQDDSNIDGTVASSSPSKASKKDESYNYIEPNL